MSSPIFTKRHYEKIASALRASAPLKSWDANKHTQFEVTMNALCAMFAEDNVNFKKDKFLKIVFAPEEPKVPYKSPNFRRIGRPFRESLQAPAKEYTTKPRLVP